ncbi:hypothetical protein GCM10010317_042970 [Streptomyces mirabilis]|nr:hypothetical protein GCM10010317_042970 [Streptomyces mirabilis]
MEPYTRRVADTLYNLAGQLTTDKEDAPKELAARAVHIAQACARGQYVALLPGDQLGEDPGRDRVDGPAARARPASTTSAQWRRRGAILIVTAVGDDGHSCAAARRGDAP